MSALVLGSNSRPQPPGGEDDGLRSDQMQFAGANLQRHDAGRLPVFHDERGDEPFFVALHAGLDKLFEHHVEQSLSREVADEKGARPALTTESPRTQTAVIVPV